MHQRIDTHTHLGIWYNHNQGSVSSDYLKNTITTTKIETTKYILDFIYKYSFDLKLKTDIEVMHLKWIYGSQCVWLVVVDKTNGIFVDIFKLLP